MLAIHALAFRATAGKSLGFTIYTLTSNFRGKGLLPGKAKARFHRLQHPENPMSTRLLHREGRISALSQPLQILCHQALERRSHRGRWDVGLNP